MLFDWFSINLHFQQSWVLFGCLGSFHIHNVSSQQIRIGNGCFVRFMLWREIELEFWLSIGFSERIGSSDFHNELGALSSSEFQLDWVEQSLLDVHWLLDLGSIVLVSSSGKGDLVLEGVFGFSPSHIQVVRSGLEQSIHKSLLVFGNQRERKEDSFDLGGSEGDWFGLGVVMPVEDDGELANAFGQILRLSVTWESVQFVLELIEWSDSVLWLLVHIVFLHCLWLDGLDVLGVLVFEVLELGLGEVEFGWSDLHHLNDSSD